MSMSRTAYGLSKIGDDWREQAACRRPGVHPELFWPDRDDDRLARVAALALHICRSHCPVRRRCDREYGPQVQHPCVVGGRRYTMNHGGKNTAMGESTVTQPSSVGCPICEVER